MGWLGRTLDRTAHWLLKWRIIRGPARWMVNSRYAWSIVSRTDRVRARRLQTRVMDSKLPQHISIIMDGNRRFAADTGLAATLGHRAGKEKLEDVMGLGPRTWDSIPYSVCTEYGEYHQSET